MLDEKECDRIREFNPRTAHEHALLAQLPEFYSPDPSRDKLRSIARRVLSSTEDENRAFGRAVVKGLCPAVSPGVAPVTILLYATIAVALFAWLVRYFASLRRMRSRPSLF